MKTAQAGSGCCRRVYQSQAINLAYRASVAKKTGHLRVRQSISSLSSVGNDAEAHGDPSGRYCGFYDEKTRQSNEYNPLAKTRSYMPTGE